MALRKSLAVAEQDVRKKQEEMEELRSQLVNQDYEQRLVDFYWSFGLFFE